VAKEGVGLKPSAGSSLSASLAARRRRDLLGFGRRGSLRRSRRRRGRGGVGEEAWAPNRPRSRAPRASGMKGSRAPGRGRRTCRGLSVGDVEIVAAAICRDLRRGAQRTAVGAVEEAAAGGFATVCANAPETRRGRRERPHKQNPYGHATGPTQDGALSCASGRFLCPLRLLIWRHGAGAALTLRFLAIYAAWSRNAKAAPRGGLFRARRRSVARPLDAG